MNGQHSPSELTTGYEALRAQAVGDVPTDTPRGLALVLTQGLPVWMRAWAAPLPAPLVAVPAGVRAGSGGLGSEIVRVLTEMALAGGKKLATS